MYTVSENTFTVSESFPPRKRQELQIGTIYVSDPCVLGGKSTRIRARSSRSKYQLSIYLKQKSSLGDQSKREWILILFTRIQTQNRFVEQPNPIMQKLAVNHWLKAPALGNHKERTLHHSLSMWPWAKLLILSDLSFPGQ